FFRALSASLRGEPEPLRSLVADTDALERWVARWHESLRFGGEPSATTADAMDRVNPKYIPRNHKVEEALTAATAGDLAPLHRLRRRQTRVDQAAQERGEPLVGERLTRG